MGGGYVVADGRVEDILGCRVFLDCLDVSGDGDVEGGQLDGDGSEWLDHLCLVLGEAS